MGVSEGGSEWNGMGKEGRRRVRSMWVGLWKEMNVECGGKRPRG